MLDGIRLSTSSDRIAKLKELYSKRYRAKYRHAIGRPRGNLYYSIRKLLGLNQTEAGKLIGISQKAWQYRERVKVMYWPLELVLLHEISGLSSAEFAQLLNDIA